MPKLYFECPDQQWVVPGQQSRSALRFDIPNSPAELAAWLNDRRFDPHGIAAPQPEPEGFLIPDNEIVPTGSTFDTPPAGYLAQSLDLDEAFERLPLARQLHFAALAMENARTQLNGKAVAA